LVIDVCASAGRLERAGYIEGDYLSRGIKDYLVITAITTRGLREVGAYPNPSNLAERLQRFLEAQAAEADRTERGKRIRQAARALAEVGTSFAAKFAAELAKPY